MLRLTPLRWMSVASILLVTLTGAWTVARALDQQRAMSERTEWEARAAESRARVLRAQVSVTPPAPDFVSLALRIDPAIDPRTTHVAWLEADPFAWLESAPPISRASFRSDGTRLQLVDADTPDLGYADDPYRLRVEIMIDTADPAAPRASARVLEWTPSDKCWTSNSSWWEVQRGEISLSASPIGDANGLLVRYTIEGRRKISSAVRLVR